MIGDAIGALMFGMAASGIVFAQLGQRLVPARSSGVMLFLAVLLNTLHPRPRAEARRR